MAPRERGKGLPKGDDSDMNNKGRKGLRSWRQRPFAGKAGLMVQDRSPGNTELRFKK